MPQNEAELWEEIFTIVTILIFAFIGSFLKSYVSKIVDQRRFKFSEVIISTIMASLVSYYIIYPLCIKVYNAGTKTFTGIMILIGFIGYNLTETFLKILKEIHSLKPKGILIVIIGLMLKAIGVSVNLKELIEQNKKTPQHDIHDNHYTTINNTYIQSSDSKDNK